ncbi:hypothetical protein K0M31_011822 [Melipona bicolor]|uniref:Uncharacterized protein n=1 Tax=Melipona bicolor TaxID=60889 RepID=A0AA40GBI1_9HYME|nr:hypothetical protein K0M31_011822 [Melipona bicolor]
MNVRGLDYVESFLCTCSSRNSSERAFDEGSLGELRHAKKLLSIPAKAKPSRKLAPSRQSVVVVLPRIRVKDNQPLGSPSRPVTTDFIADYPINNVSRHETSILSKKERRKKKEKRNELKSSND